MVRAVVRTTAAAILWAPVISAEDQQPEHAPCTAPFYAVPYPPFGERIKSLRYYIRQTGITSDCFWG